MCAAARSEQRAQAGRVGAAAGAHLPCVAGEFGDHGAGVGGHDARGEVEPGGAPPVQDEGAAAVADLDQPGLLEALHGLADRVPVHPELGRQVAFGGERGAGQQRPAENPVAQYGVELVGDRLPPYG